MKCWLVSAADVKCSYWRTWTWVILEKLIVGQLVSKFSASYGIRIFITVFTKARHRAWSRGFTGPKCNLVDNTNRPGRVWMCAGSQVTRRAKCSVRSTIRLGVHLLLTQFLEQDDDAIMCFFFTPLNVENRWVAQIKWKLHDVLYFSDIIFIYLLVAVVHHRSFDVIFKYFIWSQVLGQFYGLSVSLIRSAF
jgi:hypothetical protein